MGGAAADMIDHLLGRLGKKRPVFHSEADFQHALAWELHLLCPSVALRLEWPVRGDETRFIDIAARLEEAWIGIELKYWTSILKCSVGDEQFQLPERKAGRAVNQRAFWEDVRRLEALVAQGQISLGYVVALANDQHHWNKVGIDTAGEQYSLQDGRLVEARLDWSARAGPGTKKGYESPIVLQGRYELHWKPYSCVGQGKNMEFRYLALEVKGGGAGAPRA